MLLFPRPLGAPRFGTLFAVPPNARPSSASSATSALKPPGNSGDRHFRPSALAVHSAFRTPHSAFERPPSCFSPAADAGDRKQAARFNAETAEKGADWGKANDKQQ